MLASLCHDERPKRSSATKLFVCLFYSAINFSSDDKPQADDPSDFRIITLHARSTSFPGSSPTRDPGNESCVLSAV